MASATSSRRPCGGSAKDLNAYKSNCLLKQKMSAFINRFPEMDKSNHLLKQKMSACVNASELNFEVSSKIVFQQCVNARPYVEHTSTSRCVAAKRRWAILVVQASKSGVDAMRQGIWDGGRCRRPLTLLLSLCLVIMFKDDDRVLLTQLDRYLQAWRYTIIAFLSGSTPAYHYIFPKDVVMTLLLSLHSNRMHIRLDHCHILYRGKSR